MQRVSGAKPQHVLISKLRCHPELPAPHAKHGEALGDKLVKHGERRGTLIEVDLARPHLIARAEDISVIVQSLIRSPAASCCASQA